MVSPNTYLLDAIALMTPDMASFGDLKTSKSCDPNHVWVLEGDRILGVLTVATVVHLSANPAALPQLSLSEVLVSPQAILSEVALSDGDVITDVWRSPPVVPIAVVDEQQRLVGMITRESLWSAVAAVPIPASTAQEMSPPSPAETAPAVNSLRGTPLSVMSVEAIFDTLLAGYWDWDIPANQEYLSPGFKRMFGYADHELPNAPEAWQNLIFPEDLAKVMASFERHVSSRGQEPFDNEVRYHHKNGDIVWVNCVGEVVAWDEQGQPLRMIGCHIDITQQKRAELETQQTKEELENFFTVALDLLCIADTEGYFRRVNQAWETTLGYAPAELEGQSFLALVHPDDIEETLAAIAQLTHQERVQSFVNRYRCRDGSYRYIEWYSQPQGDLIYAAARDITEHRQLEMKLRRREAHLKTAQRIAKLGSWEFEVATGRIIWSDEVFEIFGRDPALGPPSYAELLTIYHPDDQAYHDRVVQEAIKTQQPYDLDLRAFHPDGRLMYLQARGEPIFNAAGELVQLVGVLLDITERKQTEAQLRQTSAQLAASNDELEAFAYSVSHDLRAPLRAIEGFSQALLEDYGDQFDQLGQRYFDRIRHNVARMNDLINALLALSRVSRSAMTCTWVNLSDLVTAEITELQTINPDRQVTLIVPPQVVAWGDRTLLGVVISNLVQNSWKFTQHHPTAQIELGQCDRGEQPTYFIRDDGAGFDMAHADMLFGVFQRLHNMTEFPGTGVGLATAKRIIQRHGGKMWGTGAVEAGATIYFSLPMASDNATNQGTRG
ncbi:PAS domain-containing protein [Leptolyngbya iicbica]|uniref:histidine kinase n=1 Tax=Lyngbya confervoides BDU141951 TaxID=1574623 RepID=A0A8T6QPW0_9CYAN|nr:PAS domain-containing protein [Leptolyngbya sp. LK]